MMWDDEDGIAPSFTPHLVVDDAEPVWTGLFDARGEPLYRHPERMGFHNPLDD